MRLLLDTHIWIWLATQSERLKIRDVLRNPSNELWLSPLNTWEVLTLCRKKRIALDRDAADWVEAATAGTHEAPLTRQVVLAAHDLPLHDDPVDRFLAATALVYELVLVTADDKLLNLPGVHVMANS
ncbi:MAG TPA: type II toxin-antitoxin system VapC family toxin [Candidatus Acidoferrales bacterium]|nr:type II toxin-antitoxin system VapC family toxin [Candidatus Acidoferrales bacterium]